MTANTYYFFTNTTLLLAQTAGAYGPIPKATATDPDEYRVTSLHTASSNPTAYAACDATVCVQRVSATLVNIILKPRVQPALNFAPIKYIVYKGIVASSLINGTETAAATSNDLTRVIWETQSKKNASAGTSFNPPAEALGIGMNAASGPDFADTEPIDNLFYCAGMSFQPPPVDGGASLGLFDKTGFGMEILMDGLAFHHPLSLARQQESRISVTALTGNETLAQRFDHWHAKEQVLGYMDPCAFYGSFFLAGVQAKGSGNYPFAKKSGNALYHDVLFAFAHRNMAYLDIRNEHNFSFDYFQNYGRSIVLSYDPTSTDPSPVDYYGSHWPILTLPASSFPPANTAKARNTFRIQLPVGDNPRPLLYVSQGYRDINGKGDGFPAELTSAERFYDAFEAPVGGYTTTKNRSGLTSMTFAVPNVTGQGATTPAGCYIRLKYLKQEQGVTTVPTVIRSANHLDNLVYPLDLSIPFKQGAATIRAAVYDEEIFVNAQNIPGLNCDFIGKVGIARDADNTTFYVFPTNVRTQTGPASTQVTLCGETSDAPGGYVNLIALKYPLLRVRKSSLALSATVDVPVAEFDSDGDAAAQARLTAPDFDKVLVIVVANTVYDFWKSNVPTALDRRFRSYLGVKSLQAQTDSSGVDYTSFELVVRGFALDASTGNYTVRETNTDPVDATTNIRVYANAGA